MISGSAGMDRRQVALPPEKGPRRPNRRQSEPRASLIDLGIYSSISLPAPRYKLGTEYLNINYVVFSVLLCVWGLQGRAAAS